MSKIICSTSELGPAFSETVLAELDTRFSRKTVQLAPSTGPLPFGLVMMKSADGKYAPLTETPASGEGETATPAKMDGNASAILLSPVPASASAQSGLILRGYAIVNIARLAWDSSVSDKSAALCEMEKLGFIFENIEEAENGAA